MNDKLLSNLNSLSSENTILNYILSNEKLGILVEDNKRQITFNNDIFVDIFKFVTKKSLIGESIEILASQLKTLSIENFDEFFEQNKSVNKTIKINNCFVELKIFPIEKNNQIEGRIWRVKQSDLISEDCSSNLLNANLLNTTFESTTDCQIILNKEYKILAFNNNASGYAEKYWNSQIQLGQYLKQYTEDISVWNIFSTSFEKALEGKTVTNEQIFPKDDKTFWFYNKFTPIYDNNKEVIAISLSSRDITERKRAEQKLINREQILNKIICNLPKSIILIVEKDLSISFTSKDLTQDIAGEKIYNIYTGYEELIKSELNNTFNGIDSIFEIKTTNQYLLFRTTPLKKDNKITQILVVIQDISNDKKLVRSQGIASAFLNSNTDSIIILNKRFECIYLNERMAKRFNRPMSEILNRDPSIYMDKEIANKRKDHIAKVFETGIEERWEDKRTNIWYDNVATAIFNDHKEVELVALIARDITYLKNTEQALKESEEKYMKIFYNAITPIFVTSEEGNIINCNDSACKMLEYSKEEILKLNVLDIDGNENKEVLKNKLNTVAKYNNFIFETKHISKSGKIYDVDVQLTTITINNKLHYLSTVYDITNQKKTKLALMKSERQLKNLLDSFPDSVYVVSPDFKIEYMNDKIKKRVGGDKIGQPCHKAIYNNDFICSWCIYDELNKNNKIITYDMYVKQWDKYKTIYNILLENNSKLTILFDITEKVKAIQDLNENERYQKFTNKFLTKAIQIEDINEIYEFVSKTINRMFPEIITVYTSIDENEKTATIENIEGLDEISIQKVNKICGYEIIGQEFPLLKNNYSNYKKGELIEFEKGLVGFSSHIFTDQIANELQKSLKLNKTYAIGLNFNNKLLAVSRFLTLNNYEIKNKAFLENLVKQISIVIERKYFEKKLKISEQKFRTLIENQGEGVAILDKNENFIFVNPVSEQIFGVEKGTLLNRNLKDFLSKKDVDFLLKQTEKRKKGIRNTYELPITKPNGERVHLITTVTSQLDSEGKLETAFGVFRDITELKKVEKELRLAIKTKDKFFNIIAHDLKSPFNAILGFSEILYKNKKSFDEEKIDLITKSLYQSTKTAYELLENLLTWSRTQTNKIEYTPTILTLSSVINNNISNIEAIAMQKEIRIMNLSIDEANIYADEHMINTVFRNLISNSIKFTKEHGTIKISTKLTDNHVEISIIDNGVGISKEKINNLFKIDKNTSTKGTKNESGTGLGLIICKEFIEKNNGKIWAESDGISGSVFSFSLPIFKIEN